MTIADLRLGLRAFLLADNDISSAVGDERVFPLKMPQGETGASIVYTRISGQGDYHMGGPSGLARPRFQIDCWAPTIDAAVVLGNLVKARIDGYRGPMPYGDASPQASIDVQGVFMDNEFEGYDDAAKLYRASRDYLIWSEEF